MVPCRCWGDLLENLLGLLLGQPWLLALLASRHLFSGPYFLVSTRVFNSFAQRSVVDTASITAYITAYIAVVATSLARSMQPAMRHDMHRMQPARRDAH